jgi:hypothetical protein
MANIALVCKNILNLNDGSRRIFKEKPEVDKLTRPPLSSNK